MPQSKQMKLQWLTIDGRNVPFALPQHWNGGDWAITGVDNPLPTANYIEKNGIMVPVSENNPVPTQLTGSNMEQAIERRIYTGDASSGHIEVPFGIKGAYITLNIFGTTGTFADNQGVSLRVFTNNSSRVNNGFEYEERIQLSNRQLDLYWYPGLSFDTTYNYIAYSQNKYKVIGLPLGRYLRVFALISGTFESGQGIDCEVIVRWLT